MPKLIVIDSKGNQTHFPFEKDILTIGKSNENDLILNKAEVSRRHCRIVKDKSGYRLEDLDSANGVFLEGTRIQGTAPLANGANIGVGDYLIVFKDDGATGVVSSRAASTKTDRPAPPPPDTRATGVAEKRARTERLAKQKARIHKLLLDSVDLKKIDLSSQSQEGLRKKTRSTVEALLRTDTVDIPPDIDKARLVTEIVREAVGLGPLEEFLSQDDITEIMVNNWDSIYIERKGKIQKTDEQFTDNNQVMAIIRRIIAPIGRRIDESSPMVDARLPDGSRVNAIIHPLSLTGPTLTIRKFSREPFKMKDLVGFGTVSPQMGEFLKLCVLHKQNCLVSGGTGSGKTTLLNVLSLSIPGDERIVTIEDSAELKLNQEHVVSLEAKPPNIEGKGAIPIRKLVMNSLRMRPDRIIVGECRGAEALDMLQAMNTGHDGSLTTVHSNSARDATSRLETMVLMAGTELPSRAIREQIANAINIIVHTARLTDGARKVVSISEITGMEGDVITLQEIFKFEQSGVSPKGAVLGEMQPTRAVPKFVHGLKKRGINIDLAIFR